MPKLITSAFFFVDDDAAFATAAGARGADWAAGALSRAAPGTPCFADFTDADLSGEAGLVDVAFAAEIPAEAARDRAAALADVTSESRCDFAEAAATLFDADDALPALLLRPAALDGEGPRDAALARADAVVKRDAEFEDFFSASLLPDFPSAGEEPFRFSAVLLFEGIRGILLFVPLWRREQLDPAKGRLESAAGKVFGETLERSGRGSGPASRWQSTENASRGDTFAGDAIRG